MHEAIPTVTPSLEKVEPKSTILPMTLYTESPGEELPIS